ncbi:hypothetical protein PCAR4_210065 [Paraburkholderia caribensis]|nr:hypothetical protein PCAR4_210065 [Paraburkholderia caribensis]
MPRDYRAVDPLPSSFSHFAQPRVRQRYPLILCAFITAVANYLLTPFIPSGHSDQLMK